VHPHDSCGVFIERVDGSVERIFSNKEMPNPALTSYAMQHELCCSHLEEVIKNGNAVKQMSQAHSMKDSIYLL